MPIKLLYTFLFYFVILTAQGNILAVYEHKHAEGESGTFTLAEQHLYGASRIGMTKPNLALNTTTPDAPVPTIHYELTNHLGNVMAVITDEPATTETPAVESLTDYYPFGMTMPGRSYNAHTYRHGFTGHEKESDLAEGIYTTEYRLYDARVGRWLSVDPLFEKYVGMSPYNYCMLNPVMMVDPDGRKFIFVNKDAEKKFMSYIRKINDKSLLRDFEQLKASTIPYHVEFKGNTNIFGVACEVGGYLYPSYYSRVDELTEIKGSGLPFAFIKYDENESGFTLNSGHYSQVVPFFHELRHAALYDAIVRYIELDENVSLDLIKDAICKYNNEETNKNNPISMESLKDEGISGGEIFVLYFGAQIQADTPTELQAIEQETKIAIDQSELENGEVTRYSYDSVKDKNIRNEKNISK